MKEYVLRYKREVGIVVGTLFVLGFVAYSFVSPYGLFSGLKNDLRVVEESKETLYTTLDGEPVSLTRYAGNPIVINSWATWMPFSKDELALLTELRNTYGDTVSFIAMNRMEDTLTIRAYLEAYGISEESLIFLVDTTDAFYRAVGGYAMPETVFYRSDGTLSTHKRGVLTKEELTGYVEALDL